MSREAVDSPGVRHELSVLVTRQLLNKDVQLLLLYLDGLTHRPTWRMPSGPSASATGGPRGYLLDLVKHRLSTSTS